MILNKLKLIASVSLDFYTNNIKTINVKQCDTNSRFIHVSFTEHGKKVALNQSTMSVIARYKKPDGKFGLRDCEILEDGSVLIELTEQMTVVSGKTQLDVMILEESGIKADSFAEITSFEEYGVAVLSAMPLNLNVVATPIQGAELESEYNFTALTESLVATKIAEADMIEKNAVWAKAEELRNIAENGEFDENGELITEGRVQAEQARAENVSNLIQSCQKSVDDKIDECETKTNTAIQNASDATTSANNAATSAKNAATNATNAAEYANSEAEKCKAVYQGVSTDAATVIGECETARDSANDAAQQCKDIVLGTGVIMQSEKGVAGGVASLDETGKVPEEQLPEIKSYSSDGENSFATNDSAIALGDYTFASGENTISGYKGYHMVGYSKSADGLSVDITVRDLELTKKASDNYAIGDIVCIEANTHLFQEFKIDKIVGSAVANSVITLKRVDGQSINFNLDGGGEEEDWLFVIGKNVGEPIPQFVGAFVSGLDNVSAGKGAFGGGRNNAGSSYALYGGRNNKVAYAGLAAGFGNEIIGLYSGAVGYTNKVPYPYSFFGGGMNESTGECSAGFGYNNTIGKESFGAGHSNYVGRNGAVFGQDNYVGDYGIGGGIFGIKDTSNKYLVNIGNGTSDTDRRSAVLVEHDGTTKLGGKVYSENNKELATVAYVNEKIEQGEIIPTPSPNPNYVSCAMGNNQIYGGRDLTQRFDTGELSEKIADATFENIFPGDYISKPVIIDGETYNCKFIFADLDYYYSSSRYAYSGVNKHHVAVIVEGLPNARMHPTNFTQSTGYITTEMHTTTLANYFEAISTTLGSEHFVHHNKLLTSGIDRYACNGFSRDDGAPNKQTWQNGSFISLMNEVQVYGTSVWGPNGHNVGEAMRQLAIFKLKFYPDVFTYHNDIFTGIWLRDITAFDGCAVAELTGYAGSGYLTDKNRVVPLLLLK